MRMLYKKRQIIEHVFAHLKSHLSLERCQTEYTKQPVLVEEKKTAPQKKHIALVIMAFVILEKEACEKTRHSAKSSRDSSSEEDLSLH